LAGPYVFNDRFYFDNNRDFRKLGEMLVAAPYIFKDFMDFD